MQSLEARRRRMRKDNHKQLICCTPETGGQQNTPKSCPGKTPGQQIRQLCWGRKTRPQVQGAETAPQA